MDILNTTTNLDFNEIALLTTPITCGVKCLKTYTSSIEFKTLIDDHFSGNEQRRDQWTLPRRGWVLEFEKTPDSARIMEKFFIRQKGRKRAFQWTWNKIVDGYDTSGDNVIYTVRFDVDKIDFDIIEMGYRTFKVPIIQVMSGV